MILIQVFFMCHLGPCIAAVSVVSQLYCTSKMKELSGSVWVYQKQCGLVPVQVLWVQI